MQEPKKPVNVKGKYQIEYDVDVAQRLQAELDKEARLEREKEEEASNAALIEEWDSIEARIDVDAQLAERLQIIRADGSTKYYKLFSAMLDDFDRQDVLDLYRLVKERFETTSPEGYDRLLWGDLITLFEPIHLLLMDTGSSIHMLVEKKYPLTQEMLSRMLSGRLEVDHECEMVLSFSDLQDHSLRSRRVFGYNLLMIKKILLKKLDD
ncbi:hypothetical protein Tco_0265664 [Tanacetum coccineum]